MAKHASELSDEEFATALRNKSYRNDKPNATAAIKPVWKLTDQEFNSAVANREWRIAGGSK